MRQKTPWKAGDHGRSLDRRRAKWGCRVEPRAMRMKLAVLSSGVQGEIDQLLSETAGRLQAEGACLAGVVKVLEENPADAHACDMDLRVLPDGPRIRITQSLGSGSTGCRLNPSAITEAVAEVERFEGTPPPVTAFKPPVIEERG